MSRSISRGSESKTQSKKWVMPLLLGSCIGLGVVFFRSQLTELYCRAVIPIGGALSKDMKPVAEAALADALIEQSKFAEAAGLLEKLGAAQDPNKVMKLADCYIRTNQSDRAIEVLEPMATRDDKLAVLACQSLAHAYAEKGDWTNCEKYCRLIGGNTDHGAATNLHSLACGLFNIGKFDSVRPMYHRAIELEEKQPNPDYQMICKDLLNLASCDLKTGRNKEAAAGYERALTLSKEKLGEKHWITGTARNLKSLAEM